MKMIIDTAKASHSEKMLHAVAFLIFAGFLFLMFLLKGPYDLDTWVTIIVLAPFFWMVRFMIKKRTVPEELHMVKLGKSGITGWDMRGKMINIKWDEVGQVLEHRNVLGRELVINGPHRRRLKITESFPKYDTLAETVKGICGITGAKWMGKKEEDEYTTGGKRL